MRNIVILILAAVSLCANAQQYGEDEMQVRTDQPGTYAAPAGNGREVIISASEHIQGCNAGLVLKAGVYTCRSNINGTKEVVIATPTASGCVTGNEPECFAIVPTGAVGSSGFDASRAGRVQYGYLGTDGNLYTSPDEGSGSICTGTCQQLNTTFQKDEQVAAQKAAEDERIRRDAEAALAASSSSSSRWSSMISAAGGFSRGDSGFSAASASDHSSNPSSNY